MNTLLIFKNTQNLQERYINTENECQQTINYFEFCKSIAARPCGHNTQINSF